jgi:hypothetical protein
MNDMSFPFLVPVEFDFGISKEMDAGVGQQHVCV